MNRGFKAQQRLALVLAWKNLILMESRRKGKRTKHFKDLRLGLQDVQRVGTERVGTRFFTLRYALVGFR